MCSLVGVPVCATSVCQCMCQCMCQYVPPALLSARGCPPPPVGAVTLQRQSFLLHAGESNASLQCTLQIPRHAARTLGFTLKELCVTAHWKSSYTITWCAICREFNKGKRWNNNVRNFLLGCLVSMSSVQNAFGCVHLCSCRRRGAGCGGRIRPAASHYLLHSTQPSHLNCIQPAGFPQHAAQISTHTADTAQCTKPLTLYLIF